LDEATKVGEGGDREDKPTSYQTAIVTQGASQTKIKTPSKKGAYRLFVYIRDGKNKVATANIPFYVKEE